MYLDTTWGLPQAARLVFCFILFCCFSTMVHLPLSSMRYHVLSFATIYRESVPLSVAYGCGEIVGWSMLLLWITPTSLLPLTVHHMARYPRVPSKLVISRYVYLFWFLFTLLLTISIFTLPLLFIYSRLQLLHTRIPTLLKLILTPKSICLIKNKSLNFPESRRNKKMLKTTRGLMMVS